MEIVRDRRFVARAGARLRPCRPLAAQGGAPVQSRVTPIGACRLAVDGEGLRGTHITSNGALPRAVGRGAGWYF
jgi:hypothetical protein